MLLVVPEGRSTVVVSHNGSSATQEIDFVRNQEMAWDLGDVEITVVQKGRVIFTLNPANAKVTIDGKNVDTASPVELEYGLHQMTVTADGYDTVAQYIKVAEPSASISVELEKSEESTEQEERRNSRRERNNHKSSQMLYLRRQPHPHNSLQNRLRLLPHSQALPNSQRHNPLQHSLQHHRPLIRCILILL